MVGSLAFGFLGALAWGAGAALGTDGLRDVGQQVCGGAGVALSLSCLFNPGAGGLAAGGGGAGGGYGESDYDPYNPYPPGHRYSDLPAQGDRPYAPDVDAPPSGSHDPGAVLDDPAFKAAQEKWQKEHYVDVPVDTYTARDASGDVVMSVVRGMRGF